MPFRLFGDIKGAVETGDEEGGHGRVGELINPRLTLCGGLRMIA